MNHNNNKEMLDALVSVGIFTPDQAKNLSEDRVLSEYKRHFWSFEDYEAE